jgi:predicted transcriptional regulator
MTSLKDIKHLLKGKVKEKRFKGRPAEEVAPEVDKPKKAPAKKKASPKKKK